MSSLESPKRPSISNLLNPQDGPPYPSPPITRSSHTTSSYPPQYHTNHYGPWPHTSSYGPGGASQGYRFEQRTVYGVVESPSGLMASQPDRTSHHHHKIREGEAGTSWAPERRVQPEAYMVERTERDHIDTQVYQTNERASLRVAARSTLPQPDRAADYYRYPQQSVYLSDPGYYEQPLEPHYTGRPQHQPSPVPNPRKRTSPDTEAAEKPKAKRAKSTPQSKGSSSSSKGKRVNKGPAQNEVPEFTEHEIGGQKMMVSVELQVARCMSEKYRKEPSPMLSRCVSCTRRSLGDTCRFQGLRYLLRDEQGALCGIGFTDTIPSDASSHLDYPTDWNRALEAEPIQRSKISIAKALLPTLKAEKEHIKTDKIIRRPRETAVRVTCDTCMTSLFSSTFMCRTCGREICNDCFQLVRDVTEEPQNGTPEDVSAFKARRDKLAYAKPFFLACLNRKEHNSSDFSAVTRFVPEELDEVVSEMETLLEEANKPTDADRAREPPCDAPTCPDPSAPSSDPTDQSIAAPAPPQPSYDAATFPDPISSPLYDDYTPSNVAKIHTDIPSDRLQIIPAALYDSPVGGGGRMSNGLDFSELWIKGLPLLVKDVLPRFKLGWTPEYFTEHFGQKETMVIECQTDDNSKMTIREFFSYFGKYEDRKKCWKVKDFPPAAEFKQEFPALFEDFSNAVPVPDYVRRDGVFNIASHFPLNAIGPDLGPKMYNAFASSQDAGSKGSTRLHMDMADALNVMMYATPCEDGTEGYAVWDVFRAEDSESIRKFLRQKYGYHRSTAAETAADEEEEGSSGSGSSKKKRKTKAASKKGKTSKSGSKVATTPTQIIGHDPIHGQQFYLDVDLRRELYEQYGVKSMRVYQRPGDGVFIPAGCAHQVANMADCMKIAIDFVSPENIDRCEKLTKEFREQNQAKAWKEDVLQLRTMMWFAWQSCAANEKALKKDDAEPVPPIVEVAAPP